MKGNETVLRLYNDAAYLGYAGSESGSCVRRNIGSDHKGIVSKEPQILMVTWFPPSQQNRRLCPLGLCNLEPTYTHTLQETLSVRIWFSLRVEHDSAARNGLRLLLKCNVDLATEPQNHEP